MAEHPIAASDHHLVLRKFVISAIAVVTAISPFLADWNATHIYNAAWPPHAKFHNAQTMVFGVILGASSLAVLWLAPGARWRNLRLAAYFAALYWLAQLPAILFPGTAFYDPQFAGDVPHLFGIAILQVHLAAAKLAILAVAVFWRAGDDSSPDPAGRRGA